MRLIRIVAPISAVMMAGALGTPAQAAEETDVLGGWIEGVGAFGGAVAGADPLASAPHHTGRSEEKVINGTTNKRAHGWTTWTNVKHYTRARMWTDGDLFHDAHIFTDSGRKVGVSGTEAISGWSDFNPNVYGSPGKAKTFYGKA